MGSKEGVFDICFCNGRHVDRVRCYFKCEKLDRKVSDQWIYLQNQRPHPMLRICLAWSRREALPISLASLIEVLVEKLMVEVAWHKRSGSEVTAEEYFTPQDHWNCKAPFEGHQEL